MASNAAKLAGLAALAGAAYLYNKKKDEEGTDLGSTRAARPEGTKTEEEPRRKIEDYQAKAPLTDEDMYPSGVMGGATQPRTRVTPEVNTGVDARNLETTMSRGMQTAPTPQVGGVSSSPEGMKNYVPRRVPVVSSTEESMQNYRPRRPVPPTVPKTVKKPPYMPDMPDMSRGYKQGGKVKKMASGGMTPSKRADGIASRGKTKCKMY